jgi:hypothetical protein
MRDEVLLYCNELAYQEDCPIGYSRMNQFFSLFASHDQLFFCAKGSNWTNIPISIVPGLLLSV